jgi:predicted nucleic acid-binding protein
MRNSSIICVDAGLVVRLFAVTPDERIRELWGRWQRDDQQLAAPTLLRYEVTNALYRYQRAGMVSGGATKEALNSAFALPIRFYSDVDLHESAMAIAGRFALPAAYDAHYLALAARLGATFFTTDQRLANAVQSAFPWVQMAGT